jgi:hypothetical protein
MDQTLREVIEHYVARGYSLATLTPDARATLVCDGSELRLRLEGRWVRIEGEPAAPAPPPARPSRRRVPWLALLAAAIAGAASAALVAVALLLLTDDGELADSVARPTATASPTAAPTSTAPPTATATVEPVPTSTAPPTATATVEPTPTATAAPTPTAPAIETVLLVGDQLLGPGADAIVIEQASDAEPFYVVVFEGDASTIGPALGASSLLAPGSHAQLSVRLVRPIEDGEQVWVALHLEQNGNTSFDGPAVDRARVEGVTGSRGPQGQVAARIGVTVGAPIPPVSGGAGSLAAPRRAPAAAIALLTALALAAPLAARARSRGGRP